MDHNSCEQQTQPSSEPRLCVAGCGFWGNPATMDLCSKCHREKMQQEHAVAAVEAAASPAKQPDVEMPAPSPEQAPASDAPVVAEAVVEDATQLSDVPAAPVEEEPAKPVQANRNRCFCCKKKVGLLGFECRCGYVYCSSHRHAQDHSCTFDYAAFDRERLAKANPLVAASKVEKL